MLKPVVVQALATRGHGEFLKLLTEGPLQSVTDLLGEAADWVTGHSSVGSDGLTLSGGEAEREETNEGEGAKNADSAVEAEEEDEQQAGEGHTRASIS